MIRVDKVLVGYANRRMHARDVLSILGRSASSETREPSSRPCSLYSENISHILGLSPFLLVLYNSKPLEVLEVAAGAAAVLARIVPFFLAAVLGQQQAEIQ